MNDSVKQLYVYDVMSFYDDFIFCYTVVVQCNYYPTKMVANTSTRSTYFLAYDVTTC